MLALVHSETSVAKLKSQGLEALALDLDKVTRDTWPLQTAHFENASLFYLAPPPPRGESDARLDRFLWRIQGRPTTFVYMSTTGVYGDTDGAEVDESKPVNPQTERAQRRVSAEHMTRVWCTENQVRRVVLRVPGIYGPGRLPIERLQRGEPVIRLDEAGIANRIHVDDLATVCLAVAADFNVRGVYNVTDGSAISSTAFLQRVAQLANLPPPPEISLEEARLTFSAERMSFLDESRRVSNRRLLADVNIQLKYANIDDGIRASLVDTNYSG